MNHFFQSFAKLAEPLGDSEYLYLLLEPAFIYGIGLGLIALVIAYFIKNTPFQILALALVALSSLTIFPYLSLREKAQGRIEKVYRIESPTRADDFKENTDQRRAQLWLYLTVAITASAAAMIGPHRNRLGLLLAMVCFGFAAKTIQYSIWMHYQEALFSQPHLKKNDSPVQQRLKDKQASKNTFDIRDPAPPLSGGLPSSLLDLPNEFPSSPTPNPLLATAIRTRHGHGGSCPGHPACVRLEDQGGAEYGLHRRLGSSA